jgi:hypothetical protein
MRRHTICAILVLSLLLAAASMELTWAEQPGAPRQGEMAEKETLRVMAKGPDSIVVGEEHLYVVPAVTRITNLNGAVMSLSSLRTPCQAEVTYTRWVKGVKKGPVALHIRVLKEYPGASAFSPREQ